jgi:hypothetical protein
MRIATTERPGGLQAAFCLRTATKITAATQGVHNLIHGKVEDADAAYEIVWAEVLGMLDQDLRRKADRQFDASGYVRAGLELALRYCAAAMIGVAVVVGSIVVWAIASIVLAVVGDAPSDALFEQ